MNPLKLFIAFVVIGCTFNSAAQFSTGINLEVGPLSSEQDYIYAIGAYNENETVDYYLVRTDFAAAAPSISIRSFGNQFSNPKKFCFGYSLEIGYRFFSTASDLTYLYSSTNNRDSIVNAFDGLQFKTTYHSVLFNHYFDFHWNPTDKIKITNSIGVGISAVVKAGTKALPNGTTVSTNFPVLSMKYQPQITEKYKRFSISYFASIDLFGVSLFSKPSLYEKPDLRIPLSSIRFNTLGLRFIPHPKKRKPATSYGGNE